MRLQPIDATDPRQLGATIGKHLRGLPPDERAAFSAGVHQAMIYDYLDRLAGNVQHLNVTDRQRETIKAALRALIQITPFDDGCWRTIPLP